MGAEKRTRQRMTDRHAEQPDDRGEEPTVEVGPAIDDEEPSEQERLVALAEQIRKEAARAYQRET